MMLIRHQLIKHLDVSFSLGSFGSTKERAERFVELIDNYSDARAEYKEALDNQP